jgi:isoquinoline 1-oxidoreductase subunit beta
MTKPISVQADTSRREFLTAAAGFTLILTVAPDTVIGTAGADAPLAPNVWLTIATDGTITIVSPAAEMGQGTFTALPAVFATRGYFKPMRVAGAQARRVLIDAVAAKWGVPAAELSTEPSVVLHKASNRRIGYGEIAGFAEAPAELPRIEDKDLKRAAEFRFIGKDLPRLDLPAR